MWLSTKLVRSLGNQKSLRWMSSESLAQYLSSAQALYKKGLTCSTSPDSMLADYSHFAATDKSAPTSTESFSKGVDEFLEMSSMIQDYGVPEEMDQLSGAIYMHATIHEDKCSQCLRLAAEEVPKFSINALKTSLESMTGWPSKVNRSLAVMDLNKSLDNTCIDRLQSLHFSIRDQFRLSHLWQSLDYTRAEFPKHVLANQCQFIVGSSTPMLISYLLLLSSLTDQQVEFVQTTFPSETSRQMGRQVLKSGAQLSQPELVAAYMGLHRLGPTPEKDDLKNQLESTFGLRLA